jgi:hypothetical protein
VFERAFQCAVVDLDPDAPVTVGAWNAVAVHHHLGVAQYVLYRR